jgi:hypothetical protein
MMVLEETFPSETLSAGGSYSTGLVSGLARILQYIFMLFKPIILELVFLRAYFRGQGSGD